MNESFPYMLPAEGQLQEPQVLKFCNVLKKYDQKLAIAAVAGMLTIPKFQANCYRLEILAHLIVASCSGNAKLTSKHISNWLNRQLGDYPISTMEDPAEDVFVSNILTNQGDFLVLGGLWESPDASTSLLIKAIERYGSKDELKSLAPAVALLKISDFILKRAGLKRWQIEPSTPKVSILIKPSDPWDKWSIRAKLTISDLESLGISLDLLQPFIFNLSDSATLLEQSNQESELHVKPLIQYGNELILSLPTSVTYAVKRFVLKQAKNHTWLDKLEDWLMSEVMQQAVKMVESTSRHQVEYVTTPHELSQIPEFCQSHLFRVGKRRYIHLMFLSDPLAQFAEVGLLQPTEYGEEEEKKLDVHIENFRLYIDTNYQVDSAHTLLLLGHLGQPFLITFPETRHRWSFDLCRIHDLIFILQDSDGPLDKLICMLEQRKLMLTEGLEFFNMNGLINLYAYWIEQSCCLRLPDIPHAGSGFIHLATDHVTSFRIQRRKSLDEHCELSVHGATERVIKADSDSIYSSIRDLPIYISLTRIERHALGFCILFKTTTVWVTSLTNSSDNSVRHACFKLWEGLQQLVYKFLKQSEGSISFSQPVVELLIDFRGLLSAQEARDSSTLSDSLELLLHRTLPVARLVAGPAFLRHFVGIKNTGEVKLLGRVIAAFYMLAETSNPAIFSHDAEALSILGGSDAKILHTFESERAIEHLLSTHARPIFRRPEEHIGFNMRSAFSWLPPCKEKRSLSTEESCQELNNAVTHLLHKIAQKLKLYNKKHVVSQLLFLHETLINDRHRWRSTARAVRALYGNDSGTSAAEKVERERSEGTLTLRVLIEAAVCECSEESSLTLDEYSTDELYGLMCALINLGRDSETIYHGLASEGISIYPSGAYAFTADILSEIGNSYTQAGFNAKYVAAAEDYENWVLPSEKRDHPEKEGEFGTEEFLSAFRAEYGFGFPELIEIVGCLMDLCLDKDTVVISQTRDEIVNLCEDRPVNPEDIDAFLNSFSLKARNTWAPQSPVKPSDVEPWRFERKLSVILRPLIECKNLDETTYVFGVGTMRESFAYIIDSISNGKFDKDVFVSRNMRSYIGKRVDEAGRSFTHEVAALLRKLGWQALEEVKMTQLGAGKSPNLGDIDVLAWSEEGYVLAIECKRLKGARTISEIAQNCSRFQGNVGDHLHKHIRRITWLDQNRPKLEKFLNIPTLNLKLFNPLVTNIIVPFKYTKELPVSTKDIIPVDSLSDYLIALSLR